MTAPPVVHLQGEAGKTGCGRQVKPFTKLAGAEARPTCKVCLARAPDDSFFDPAQERSERTQVGSNGHLNLESDEGRLRALTVLALEGGDTKRACERLDLELDYALELEGLRLQHVETYAAIADEMATQLEQAIAREFRELLTDANRAAGKLVRKINDDIDVGNYPRDIDRALTAISKVQGTSTDKLLSLTGRPVDGKKATDPKAIIAELRRLGVYRIESESEVIEGEAKELAEGTEPDG